VRDQAADDRVADGLDDPLGRRVVDVQIGRDGLDDVLGGFHGSLVG
jgi:hypothetical protein